MFLKLYAKFCSLESKYNNNISVIQYNVIQHNISVIQYNTVVILHNVILHNISVIQHNTVTQTSPLYLLVQFRHLRVMGKIKA